MGVDDVVGQAASKVKVSDGIIDRVIDRARDLLYLDKLCECLPFEWTIHSAKIPTATHPKTKYHRHLCYYTFAKGKNRCGYAMERKGPINKILKRTALQTAPNVKLYDCLKKSCDSCCGYGKSSISGK